MSHEYAVEIGKLLLRCTEFGPPEGASAVLLHAAGQDRSSWVPVAEHLAALSWNVVTVDQRGHGASSWTDDYSFELMREDITHLITALDLDPAVVVGHSMGGTVATLMAEQSPELVRLLVLEDTPPPRRRDEPLSFPAAAPEHLHLDPRAWTALMGELADPDPAWWNGLDSIPAPVLMIAGGTASHVPQDDLSATVSRIPTARMVTLEGAGHQVHKARTQDFLAVLGEFLAENSGVR